MKTGIIYKVTSPSKKVYIGQTVEKLIARRWKHESEARLGSRNSKFARAINKYKNDLKWEVLFDDIPIYLLDLIECETIKIYDSCKNGYNTLESAELDRTGMAPWNKGKINVYSEDSLKRRAEAATGRKHSEATKQKMRDAKIGKKLTEEHKKKIGQGVRKS